MALPQVDNRVLHLNGVGVHEATIFNIDIYVGGLYLERLSSNARQILDSTQSKLLLLRFRTDVSPGDLRDSLRAVQTAHSKKLGDLLQKVTRIRDGDLLALSESPEHVLELRHNGALLGSVQGRSLCQEVFANWIGAHPVSPKLKRNLLGRH